jgi:hypothetical protein
VIFCINIFLRLGEIKPLNVVLVDDDVLDDRGSVDGGTGLLVIVPLTVIVKVHRREALIR